MSVPSNIERLLADHQVSYSLTQAVSAERSTKSDIVELKAYNAARAILLKTDNNSKLIVITRSNTLLDLNQINHLFNAEYKPFSDSDLKRFMHECGVDAIPALPGLNGLPSVVDKGLLKYKSVFLEVNTGNQYLQLTQNNFRQLLREAKVANIVAPLAKLEATTNPKDDIKAIKHSVNLFTERRVRNRLEEVLEFPPLPVTAERIIKLRVNAHADISDLTDIIELDASLSAQMVSWASSPYYSAPGAIKSVHDAIVRVLGFDMVLNLALGLSLGKTLKMPRNGPHGCLPYWQQSVYTAAATEAIVACIPKESRPSFGTAYLSGLLNNFGYLIISEIFTSQFESICRHIDSNPQASVQAVEQHIIGVDRNQLASWLMEYWHMPESVCNALRHQNNPHYQGNDWEYALILYLSNKLLQEYGLKMGSCSAPISDDVFNRLNITKETATEVINQLMESSEELDIMAKQMGD